jgi:hypothetical protein
VYVRVREGDKGGGDREGGREIKDLCNLQSLGDWSRVVCIRREFIIETKE